MRLALISLMLALVAAQKNTGCPKLPVDPCICHGQPFPFLTCDKIDDPDVLQKVFQNSARTSFLGVRLQNSVLQYLPSDLFKNVRVLELQLHNSTLVQLFDETPENTQDLRTIHIENTFIFKGILWEHLAPMEHLRILNIYRNRVETIGYDFVEYVPKHLEQLTFYDTKTAEIKPGVFNSFPKLDKVAIDHCELTELRRNMFPVPFNGRVLYFNENLLVTLPKDLFTEMPNLQTVGLRGNSIATLPPEMFASRFKKLEYFLLADNPLYCDSKLKWLIINKPQVLTGDCFSPPRMHGLRLDELEPDQLLVYDD